MVYLDAAVLGAERTGRAVDHPGWADPVLHAGLDRLHRALGQPGMAFEAESRLALVVEQLRRHLRYRSDRPRSPAGATDRRRLARELRELLDAHVVTGISLARAGSLLQAPESAMLRAFSAEYGIPPHRYLTGRRLDRARRLLLGGERAAEVAVTVGFHDQAHLSRHFRRLLGVPPGRYARDTGRLDPERSSTMP